ncbi:PEP-CTERM sorting domain-containing protein [Magnetospira sp. QH-2]|uniref:PEP-CTERM sorting domain-containing protein n=1 Tax=Magnetospira sp. (strain QH-2) TaxID=1288970 RepID=UPI0003E8163F|nr:PEP-CTERM sorting domain-containing protein [Magnetospira sp. QH-2]CCQ73173.1 Exported protein of unknown function [Magnetospira sp. QH-2]
MVRFVLKAMIVMGAIAVLSTREAQATVLFYDDFEQESVGQIPSQWQNYIWAPGSNYVVDTLASEGSQSLRLQSFRYQQRALIAPGTSYQGDSVLSFDFYLPDASAYGSGARYGGVSYMGTDVLFRYAGNGEAEAILNAPGYPGTLGSIGTDQWHTATVHIDWSASQFALDINGILVSGLAFTQNTSGNSHILARGDNWPNSPNLLYIDPITLAAVPVAEPASLACLGFGLAGLAWVRRRGSGKQKAAERHPGYSRTISG